MDTTKASPRKRKASQDAEGEQNHADHRFPAGPSSAISSAATSTPTTVLTTASDSPKAPTPTSVPVPAPELLSEPVPALEPISTSPQENITSTETTQRGISPSAIAQYPSTPTPQADHAQTERNALQAGTSSQHAVTTATTPIIGTNSGNPVQTTEVTHNINTHRQSGDDIVQRAAEFIDLLDGNEENTDTENHPVIVLDDDDDDDDEDYGSEDVEHDDDESHHNSTQDIDDDGNVSGDSDATDRWRRWLRQRQQQYLDAQERESAIVVEDEEDDLDQDEELALNAPGRRYVTTIDSRSPSRHPSRSRSGSVDSAYRGRSRNSRTYWHATTPPLHSRRQASSRAPDVVISDDNDDYDYEQTAAGTSAGHAAAAAAAAASSSSSHRHHHQRRHPTESHTNTNTSDNNATGGHGFANMSQMFWDAFEEHGRRQAEIVAPRTAIPSRISPSPSLTLPTSNSSATVSSAVATPPVVTVAPTATPVVTEPVVKTSRITDRLRCSICLELPAAPTITRCGHLFCRPCITQAQALGMGRKCPVCRTTLTASRLQNMIFETAAPAPTLVE
ncbi:hypothetical protein EMPS_08561 [Entomortierella parvispora]|uniref:RING-type domain-containing protein n=1 Tax=Entomortierella parvispora TaxID=205924 RepID=A0A9P3HH39_9FUNG|nr:hypothetical protein EMPS_08561 [Entomortierella parvispora]